MIVPVVGVWKVQMRVHQRCVLVQMAMFGARYHCNIVLMLVVFVMEVFMIMPHLRVDMLVLMTLSQM